MTLELAQTVALGPFNPFIITPEWLARTKILPGDEAEVRFKVIGEGTAFELQEIDWEIDLRRLIVSSLKQDCGDLVAKVLDQLRHTPVRAIGNNFHYAGLLKDWGDGPLPNIGHRSATDLGQVGLVDQMRWSGTFRREGVRIEVTVVAEDEVMAVLVNNHRDTDPRDYQQSIAAAKLFAHDRSVSEQILRSLLSQEVKT